VNGVIINLEQLKLLEIINNSINKQNLKEKSLVNQPKNLDDVVLLSNVSEDSDEEEKVQAAEQKDDLGLLLKVNSMSNDSENKIAENSVSSSV